jgi:cell division protein FtsW (lipid II flippase)
MIEPTAITAEPERLSPARDERADSEMGAPPVIGATPGWSGWRWVWLALGVGLVAVLVVLFQFNPARHSFYPFCAFHRVTGWQCPGCGGLRAVHHLLHGDVVTAFRFNQVVVLAVPLLAGLAVRRWVRGPKPGKISHRAQARWAWVAVGALIVFWIVRNLPLEFFRLPGE